MPADYAIKLFLTCERHPRTQLATKLFLDVEEAKSNRARKVDQQIDIAVRARLVSGVGAKQAHATDALAFQPRLQRTQFCQDFIAGHGGILSEDTSFVLAATSF